MVVVIAALYSLAQRYKTESGETAAEVIHRKVDSALTSLSPGNFCQGGEFVDKSTVEEEEEQNHQQQDEEDSVVQELDEKFLKHSKPSSILKTASAATSVTSSNITNSSIETMEASNQVRQEWINAVFGREYCLSSTQTQPRQGLGLAGVPAPFNSYSVRIPAVSQQGEDDKLGITVSRLPLGLQVRKVHPHSEAAFLGIEVGSVLVSINGMYLLAEPTKQALERLWQYEGYLESDTNSSSESDEAKSPGKEDENAKSVNEPVSMTFIKNGRLKTVLFLSNPPWGISWATCGNFPLVKRVYSFAADAGVQRGSLVSLVQGQSFRAVDHAGVAEILRDTFNARHEINLTLCFPPSEARSGHYNRTSGQEEVGGQTEKTPEPRRTKRTDDGVEIKFHSFGKALSGLYRQSPMETNKLNSRRSLSQFAEDVASGQVESPSMGRGNQRFVNAKSYSSCPPLSKELLMQKWKPMDALLYCLRFHCSGYREEVFVDSLQAYAERGSVNSVDGFSELMSGSESPAAAKDFLLQIISVICSPPQSAEPFEEKKEEPIPAESQKDGKELTSMLLKISRRDEGFSQRLYFVLRSYISSMETRRPANGKKGDGPNSLLALMNCLELLRYAEKQLAGQIAATPKEPTTIPTTKELFPSAPAPPASPLREKMSLHDSVPVKKKGIMGFLRKKQSSKLGSAPKEAPRSSIPDNGRGRRVPRASAKGSTEEKEEVESIVIPPQSPSMMYENMSDFLSQLDRICGTIERDLQKSFRKKIADWARQPWSASKDTAVANVTNTMRQNLEEASAETEGRLLVNPVDSNEILSSVDPERCYILPSAHFPLLLTFNVSERHSTGDHLSEERIYRTKVELSNLQGHGRLKSSAFVVHAAVAGQLLSSDNSRCTDTSGTTQSWFSGQELVFETRSSWGPPQTLAFRLSTPFAAQDDSGEPHRFAWFDLSGLWNENRSEPGVSASDTTTVRFVDMANAVKVFDEGRDSLKNRRDVLNLKIRVTTECVPFEEQPSGEYARKRMLLYKHDDDLRQEAFAVQFIRTCDNILKAAGLDMKLLTFQCIPVGTKRGFVEWVNGSVPLSEICQPFLDTLLENSENEDAQSSPSMIAKAGLNKYETLTRVTSTSGESLRRLTGSNHGKDSPSRNPIQDYLRSVAYCPDSPYLVRRVVMDTYVKSVAGYCVITYVLGVGE